jgi:hypothetical protein
MRKLNLFKSIFLSALALLTVVSCEKDMFKEYDSVEPGAPTTVTLAVHSITDSTAKLDYSVSGVGRLHVVVVPGNDETAVPSVQDMVDLNVSGAVFSKGVKITDANLEGTIEISDLVQNTSYKLFAITANADGVPSEVQTTDAFTTSDSFDPKIDITEDITPAISSEAKQEVGFDVLLSFNEPMVLAETYTIQMGYFDPNTGDINWFDVPKDSIDITGNVVTIKQPQSASAQFTGMYVFLTIGEGSLTDRAGNPYEGITSGIVGGNLAGIYWRNEWVNQNETAVAPTDEILTDPASLSITLTYPNNLNTSSLGYYDKSSIVVRFYNDETTTDYKVDASLLTITDNTLTIDLPKLPNYGDHVTFMMQEGALWDVYGNDLDSINFGNYEWLISYGYDVSLITANYSVDLVDNSDNPVGTYSASITTAKGANNVVINDLVKNYFGLTEDAPISGVFDGDIGTIAVPDWQELFAATVSDKPGKVYFANRFSADPVIGSISSNGNFNLDGWGFYFVSDDGALEGWLKRFNTSSWVKGSKSASGSANELVIEKIEKRF